MKKTEAALDRALAFLSGVVVAFLFCGASAIATGDGTILTVAIFGLFMALLMRDRLHKDLIEILRK